ncbi:MAG: DUF134 domain-containing protein [Chlorobiaceae bacterium]|nr:DUF134 domain-containing protein [Chlorobiaceae bacterium]NTW73793.1 DUF134 domain-containing protein [Chlorobiaceae bacterium]
MKNNRAGRPVNCRKVEGLPKVTCFMPEGISPAKLQNVVLSVDEIEAIRLADMLGLYQADAAEKMMVSRQTFGRIIQSARKKVAEALVEGKTICIEGGNIDHACPGHHTEGENVCVCLYCGFEKPHVDGIPCRTELCPDCQKPLIRKGRYSSVE